MHGCDGGGGVEGESQEVSLYSGKIVCLSVCQLVELEATASCRMHEEILFCSSSLAARLSCKEICCLL